MSLIACVHMCLPAAVLWLNRDTNCVVFVLQSNESPLHKACRKHHTHAALTCITDGCDVTIPNNVRW